MNQSGRLDADKATRVFSRAVEIRGNIESLPLPSAAKELASMLETGATRDDAELRLLILAMKGEIEFQYDLPAAEKTWTEVGRLASAMGQTGWEARSGGELGCIAFLNGEVFTALKRVATAYFRAEFSNDVAERMKTLTALGEGVAEFGRPADALRFFNRALELSAQNPDAYFPFTAYLGKARLLLATAPGEGRQMLLTGMEQAQRQNMRVRESRILIVLGVAAAGNGDHDDAVKWLKRAVEVARSAGLNRIEAEAGSKLASVLAGRDKLDEAAAYGRVSVVAAEKAGDIYHLPQNLAALGEIEASRGDLKAAEAAYAQATRVVTSLFSDLPNSRHESTVVATMGRVFQGYFELALNKLHDPHKAFEVLESARARGLVDRIRERQIATKMEEQRDPAMLLKVADLNRRLVNEGHSSDRRQLLDRLWETELRSLRFDGGPTETQSAPVEKAVPLDNLQARLRPGELVIEYALGMPHSFAFAITHDQAVPYPLKSRKEIESAISRHIQAVQARGDGRSEGRDLYALLFQPIALLGQNSRVIIVPDGKLNMAPLGAAVDPHGRYLVESHILSFAPSATAFYMLSAAKRAPTTPVEVLGVGGAFYSSVPAMPTGPELSGVGLFSSFAPPRFSKLSRSRAEVAELASAGNWDTRVLTGDDATERVLKRLPLSEFDVLHFSLHSAIDRDFPDRSALVLTANSGDQEDDLLQAREIIGLKLKAELVTLSACDGASGTPEGIAGTNSLVQAFLMAGARSVVASVWQADDAFTAALMRRFYANLRVGHDKAEALTLANRELLKQWGPAALPVYWAGFRLVGDADGRISGE
jgi:CHAT domain-containing protein